MAQRLLIAVLGIALLAVVVGCGGGGSSGSSGESVKKGTIKITGGKS
jgi:ABC-type glycerol-3-phosphate transport system substrate-binding protein